MSMFSNKPLEKLPSDLSNQELVARLHEAAANSDPRQYWGITLEAIARLLGKESK